MSSAFTVFVVDDDPVILEVIRAAVEAECSVESFESTAQCEQRMLDCAPDMLLLDVNLPGEDGYAFCRRLKEEAAWAQIPVVFVSADDTIEARLTGYDAGGDDFIVKPFDPDEMLRKVRVARQIVDARRNLKEQADASEYLSSLALASMDEAGIVLQFMSKLIGWGSDREVADGLIELMARYRLDGVVQTRTLQRELTVSKDGVDLPLEISVINHMRGMDRIFEFRQRSVHNFEHVTLMVNNMPLADPDFCGRIRDNLSVAAQGADSRLQAIETEERNRRNRDVILSLLASVRETIGDMQQAQRADRQAASALMVELDEDLARSFVHLGMTDNQERQMEELVSGFTRRLVHLLDRGEETQQALQHLGDQLGQLRD